MRIRISLGIRTPHLKKTVLFKSAVQMRPNERNNSKSRITVPLKADQRNTVKRFQLLYINVLTYSFLTCYWTSVQYCSYAGGLLSGVGIIV